MTVPLMALAVGAIAAGFVGVHFPTRNRTRFAAGEPLVNEVARYLLE